jgi:hypothetical protein
MNGIHCSQYESKLDSGKLTKVDVEVSIKLAQLSQKIPQIEKFTLNSFQESYGNYVLYMRGNIQKTKMIVYGKRIPRFPIDTDKVISITKNLRRIELAVEFERK